MSALKRAKNPPPTWLAQGAEDQIVNVCARKMSPFTMAANESREQMPQKVTHHFVKVMKEKHPSTPLHLSLQPGNHGLN
jgi:hypothetical protein